LFLSLAGLGPVWRHNPCDAGPLSSENDSRLPQFAAQLPGFCGAGAGGVRRLAGRRRVLRVQGRETVSVVLAARTDFSQRGVFVMASAPVSAARPHDLLQAGSPGIAAAVWPAGAAPMAFGEAENYPWVSSKVLKNRRFHKDRNNYAKPGPLFRQNSGQPAGPVRRG
jgi:hypothetical protein